MIAAGALPEDAASAAPGAPAAPAAGAALGDGLLGPCDSGSGVRLVSLAVLSLAGIFWFTVAPLPSAPAPERATIAEVGDRHTDLALVATARVAVNSASVAELCALPGIGPGLAGRIVADRTARGRFTSVDALERVSGIGPAIVERVRPFVRID